MKLSHILAGTAFLALLCGGAFAQPAPAEFMSRLLAADTNGDGKITFEEFTAAFPNATRERFDQLDSNKDGVISPADRPAGAEGRLRQMRETLRRADADGDGKVTFEELQAVAPNITREVFDRLDRNKDGVICPADRPDGPPPSRPAPDAKAEDRPPPPPDGRPRFRELFERADTDGDGKVSFEDLQAVAPKITREMFDRFDRDKDGYITRADMPERRGDGPPRGEGEVSPRRGDGEGQPRRGGDRRGMLERLKEADANKDGVITYEEVLAVRPDFPRAVFDRLDRNGDGVLTSADVEQD